MKKIIVIFGFITFSTLHLSGQIIDSIACQKVEDTLNIIKRVLYDVNSDPSLKRIKAIAFLEKVSRIPYEGESTFIGTEFPSKSYYEKCFNWFISNKKYLIWDNLTKSILLVK